MKGGGKERIMVRRAESMVKDMGKGEGVGRKFTLRYRRIRTFGGDAEGGRGSDPRGQNWEKGRGGGGGKTIQKGTVRRFSV